MVNDTRMSLFKQDVVDMAFSVKKSMVEAIESLVTSDKTKALKVIENDEHINHADRLINAFAIETIMLHQPVARDLRLLIGGIKIATDLERIGDYSKNICRYVLRNDDVKSEGTKHLHDTAEVFLKNFDAVIEALESMNVKAAYDAAVMDDGLDMLFKSILNRYNDDESFRSHIDIYMVNALRNIERAGDHSKNICEQIIYIVKGETIDFG